MEIKEINDREIWENFIKENSPESLFQSWDWGEVVKKAQGSKLKDQNLWRFGLFDESILIGIFQVNKVSAKRGIYLHIRHGPIFSIWNKESISFFLDYLKVLAKKERASFLRISPLIENSENNKLFLSKYDFRVSPIHAIDGEYCWVIDLAKSEENLLSSMRKTTRYLIRQAQKMGVEIVKSKSLGDLNDFLKLYKLTAQRQQFVEHKSIKEEFEQFLTNDQILLFKGYFQKKLISAALILFYNNQAVYHHSASIEQKIPVNYLLQWEVILEAKRRGKKVYNMWGIAPEGKSKHPWLGLTIFKKGFGGNTVEYIHAMDLPCSSLYCTTYLLDTLRRVWKGY